MRFTILSREQGVWQQVVQWLGYEMEDLKSWFDFGRRKKFIFYPNLPDQLWGPVTLLFKEYVENYFSGEKRLGRESGHSPPSNPTVEKKWH